MITDVICLEGNGTRPSHRGSGYSEGGTMYTLNITEVHCVAYRIGAYNSEGMKSENPHAGVYKTDTAPTLDSINCGYPACYQGGVMIIEKHDSGTEKVFEGDDK